MKVYFDMDGVLVNFSAMCPNDTNLNHPSETLSDEKRAAKKLFWQNIEKQPNFWRDIPVMANIEYLLTTAADIGEIFVLSKVPGAEKFIGGQNYVDFVAGEKRKWIAKHMNKFFDAKHIIICDGPKGKLIRPNKTDVLIDDRQENINEWESVGGQGILFNDAFSAKKQLIYMTKEDRLEIAKEQIKDSDVLVYRSLTRCSIGTAKIHVEKFKVVKDNNILFELHFDDSYKYNQSSCHGEEFNLWFGKTILLSDELTILPEHIDHYPKGILLRGEKVSKEYDDLTKMYKFLKNRAANQKRKMKSKNR